MKKLLEIVILGLLLSGSALSDNHCNENRKDWIKQLKRDLANDIGDVVYSNNQCFVEILEHNGKSIEEHSYRIAGEKRDDFKDLEAIKDRDFLKDLFSDIDVPKNINWVPKDFEKKLRSTTD